MVEHLIYLHDIYHPPGSVDKGRFHRNKTHSNHLAWLATCAFIGSLTSISWMFSSFWNPHSGQVSIAMPHRPTGDKPSGDVYKYSY